MGKGISNIKSTPITITIEQMMILA